MPDTTGHRNMAGMSVAMCPQYDSMSVTMCPECGRNECNYVSVI
jgi:hypothetical protein